MLPHIIDAAIRGGLPAEYTLPTERDAIAFCHRFYRWRKRNAGYAHIQLRRTGPLITIDEIPTGQLITKSGAAPLSPEEAEIEQLKKELGL